MGEGKFELDYSDMASVMDACSEYGDGSKKIINDILHSEAGDIIRPNITELMPQSTYTYRGHTSDRTWAGKPEHAKLAGNSAFGDDITTEMLQVTVHTSSKYSYLYFPDDGTSTQRHAGQQYFFRRGGQASEDEIARLCLERLKENFESQ